MSSRDYNALLKTLIRIGISSIKLLDKNERWIKEFFKASGNAKLEHLYKIATLSSKSQRSTHDYEIIKAISELLEGSTFLRDQNLDNWGKILEQEALGILNAMAYKLLPSFATRLFLEPDALKEETEEW